MNKNQHILIGLMSGTSLDGLDIALCSFEKNTANGQWSYQILQTSCMKYDEKWQQQLQWAHTYSALELKKLETAWTKLVVEQVNNFIQQVKEIKIDAIAFHGHTILHQPHEGFTVQMGNGAMLAAQTGIDVVCDFRQTDVALDGQGAPLVPIGDALLFADYDCCVNLGGIANLSCQVNGKRIAFDCAPCNIPLNFLAQKLGKSYDENAYLATQGQVDENLFQKLNQLSFYSKSFPKSLGREDIEQTIFPLLDTYQSKQELQNALHTLVRHTAFQIAQAVQTSIKSATKTPKILVTGGGAYNPLLMAYLQSEFATFDIHAADTMLIEFKEALIFAFLGMLRLRNETNTLASVTGARQNSIGGAHYLGCFPDL